MTAVPAPPPGRVFYLIPALARWITVPLAVAVVLASAVLKLFIAGDQPLWLDETFTAAIVSQPRFADFARQVYLDANAPLYYLIAHLWTQLFGLSDVALRLPSALFGIVTPLLVGFSDVPGLSRRNRWVWAAMLALWIPGVWYAGDARCYTLLLLLSALQTIAFVRLLKGPNLERAAIWCGVSALAILTHYYAGLLALIEGLIYLAVARKAALRTWPAALLFLPLAAWLAIHIPRVLVFSKPGVAWYNLVRPDQFWSEASFLLGADDTAYALAGIPVVTLVVVLIWRPRARPFPQRPGLEAWLAVGAAMLAAGIILGLGMLRPSFVDRYLTPSIPGVLLGVAIAAGWLGRRWPLAPAAAILAFALTTAPWAQKELRSGYRFYNWQAASTDLMRGRPERLVFFWDHPATPQFEPEQLEAAGGFFFKRAGAPVEVRAIQAGGQVDANPLILAEATPRRTAVIWAYDRGVRGTTARIHPPNLQALDQNLHCRNYSRGSVGVVACDRFDSVRTR